MVALRRVGMSVFLVCGCGWWGGLGGGGGGVGRGRNEMGWLGTFLLSWKPTWPVAMPAFLCRFAHGV